LTGIRCWWIWRTEKSGGNQIVGGSNTQIKAEAHTEARRKIHEKEQSSTGEQGEKLSAQGEILNGGPITGRGNDCENDRENQMRAVSRRENSNAETKICWNKNKLCSSTRSASKENH
jgi:hypothetical protein